MSALTILGDINWAINDYGIVEAFNEGWIDDLYEEYEYFDDWIDALKTEVDENTPEGAECVKAAEMIADALSKVKYVKECPECEGYGNVGYGEDEHGCGYCNGNGYVETDEYDQVDFKNNNLWVEKWDEEYCQAINSDLIQSLSDNEENVKMDKDERTAMKIDENQKVTLTLGQLKKLVKESSSRGAGNLYKNNDVPYSKVFSTSGYADIRIFGANDEESLVSFLISDFDIKEEMAMEIAKHLWKLKQQESYLNVIRIK